MTFPDTPDPRLCTLSRVIGNLTTRATASTHGATGAASHHTEVAPTKYGSTEIAMIIARQQRLDRMAGNTEGLL